MRGKVTGLMAGHFFAGEAYAEKRLVLEKFPAIRRFLLCLRRYDGLLG